MVVGASLAPGASAGGTPSGTETQSLRGGGPPVALGGDSAKLAGGAQPNGSEDPWGEDRVTYAPRRAGGPEPTYPVAARAEGIEGDVQVELVVNAQGAVETARVVRGAGFGFDEAVLSAVRAWRFDPALKDGRAVRVRIRRSVQFRLR
jgi:protein TonB